MNVSIAFFIVGLLTVYGGVGALDNGAEIFPSLIVIVVGLLFMTVASLRAAKDNSK